MVWVEFVERKVQEKFVRRENRWGHKAMIKFEGCQLVDGQLDKQAIILRNRVYNSC